MKIVIGKADGRNVAFELDVLLPTRLLIQANSGGGKSYLLRVLCEQLFGKVQVIVIDPEGEFSTLREKYGYVLVGKGGETPADPRSAAIVAEKLLELNASAVCDIYELKAQDRHRWVKVFLDALVNVRKELWHPCVVIVDEAHIFCPEKGQGESEAYGAVSDLATRGRKRGFCPVFATQRIGKFSKNVAAECQNVLIGSTFLDVDRKRAAESLGVPKSEERAFFDELKMLEPGKFYALGRAISRDRIMVSVATAETSHPTAGSSKHASAPPPLPDRVKHLLPKLADLPKAAEEKARTEQELRSEIRSLKAQISHKPAPEIDEQAVQKAVEAAIRQRDRENQQQLAGYQTIIEKMQTAFAVIGKQASQFVSLELPKERHAPTTIELPARRVLPRAIPQRREAVVSPDGLSASHVRVLSRLVELLECTGAETIRKEQLAAWAEYSPNSGGFNNYLGSLRSAGLIEYPSPGMVGITEEGRALSQPESIPVDSGEMLERAKRVLGGSEARILELLHGQHPQICSKTDLAEATGFSPNSGGFNNYLGHMRTLGFIDYPQKGMVRCADWLFI